jgi:ketosteroid isomerase-like protein
MSEENVEIVRAFLDAYNRLDLDGAFDYLHPDIELLGYEGRHERGRESAVAGFLDWREECGIGSRLSSTSSSTSAIIERW